MDHVNIEQEMFFNYSKKEPWQVLQHFVFVYNPVVMVMGKKGAMNYNYLWMSCCSLTSPAWDEMVIFLQTTI